jgi:hypothetical protein
VIFPRESVWRVNRCVSWEVIAVRYFVDGGLRLGNGGAVGCAIDGGPAGGPVNLSPLWRRLRGVGYVNDTSPVCSESNFCPPIHSPRGIIVS